MVNILYLVVMWKVILFYLLQWKKSFYIVFFQFLEKFEWRLFEDNYCVLDYVIGLFECLEFFLWEDVDSYKEVWDRKGVFMVMLNWYWVIRVGGLGFVVLFKMFVLY